MVLAEPILSAAPSGQKPRVPGVDERAARRTLQLQIDKLERELSAAFVAAFPDRLLPESGPLGRVPRLLDLGELEQVRDSLAERLGRLQAAIAERAEVRRANRAALEQMLLEPGRHRFEAMPLRALGEPGCGVYQVRPRLGLIGMLRGWWQVKLSSGCPLAVGHGRAPWPGCP